MKIGWAVEVEFAITCTLAISIVLYTDGTERVQWQESNVGIVRVSWSEVVWQITFRGCGDGVSYRRVENAWRNTFTVPPLPHLSRARNPLLR